MDRLARWGDHKFRQRERAVHSVDWETLVWLENLRARNGRTSKVTRRIVRDIRRNAEQTATIIPFRHKTVQTATPIETAASGLAQEYGLVRQQAVHAVLGEWQG